VWEGKALSEAAPLIKASVLRLRHIQFVASKLPTVRVVIRRPRPFQLHDGLCRDAAHRGCSYQDRRSDVRGIADMMRLWSLPTSARQKPEALPASFASHVAGFAANQRAGSMTQLAVG